MATPEELDALADTLSAPNDEIVRRAAKYLRLGGREGLETAHNLLSDAHNNLVMARLSLPSLLVGYEMDLRQDRIEIYGSVGRDTTLTPPFWKRGW